MDKESFGKAFFKQYKELGLVIEPQGPQGEVGFDKAIVSAKARLEFCSKILVFLRGQAAWMPKPKKTTSSQVSFDVFADRNVAGMVKAIALMNSSQCLTIYFFRYLGLLFWDYLDDLYDDVFQGSCWQIQI